MALGDNIRNYYEKMVIEVLERHKDAQGLSTDALTDIACVALNRLPPRYFRHEVDMAFYLSPQEHGEMRTKVKEAVDDAIEYVKESRGRGD